MKIGLEVGDRVMYSAAFLRSVGAYSGEIPRAVGEVLGFEELGPGCALARIKWDRADVPERVNVKNLVLKDRVRFEV